MVSLLQQPLISTRVNCPRPLGIPGAKREEEEIDIVHFDK
jgi:hypothetical protein